MRKQTIMMLNETSIKGKSGYEVHLLTFDFYSVFSFSLPEIQKVSVLHRHRKVMTMIRIYIVIWQMQHRKSKSVLFIFASIQANDISETSWLMCICWKVWLERESLLCRKVRFYLNRFLNIYCISNSSSERFLSSRLCNWNNCVSLSWCFVGILSTHFSKL